MHRVHLKQRMPHQRGAGDGIIKTDCPKHRAKGGTCGGTDQNGADGNGYSQKAHVERTNRHTAQPDQFHYNLQRGQKGHLDQCDKTRVIISHTLLRFRSRMGYSA